MTRKYSIDLSIQDRVRSEGLVEDGLQFGLGVVREACGALFKGWRPTGRFEKPLEDEQVVYLGQPPRAAVF